MKAPKNFYNTVDQRKLGLEDGLLPDVTAADNGDILQVVDGLWNKAALPVDNSKTLIDITMSNVTVTESDSGNGLYIYEFLGDISKVVDNDNNDITTSFTSRSSGIVVKPNTLVVIHLTSDITLVFPVKTNRPTGLNNFSAYVLAYAKSTMLPVLIKGLSSYSITDKTGIGYIGNATYTNNKLKVTLEVYTSDYPITTP